MNGFITNFTYLNIYIYNFFPFQMNRDSVIGTILFIAFIIVIIYMTTTFIHNRKVSRRVISPSETTA